MGSTEVLLKFVTILNKIIWGQDLSKGPQNFGMTRNLVIGEAIWVFDKKAREKGTETNANHELVIKDMISHLFPPKALQCKKRYLIRGLYKPRDTKIWNLICQIDNVVEYLEKFPLFGEGQCLPEDEILEIVDFLLPKEW